MNHCGFLFCLTVQFHYTTNQNNRKVEKVLRFLLVMPKIVEDKNEWYYFPQGIAYISSCMKNAGLDVITVNLNHVDDIAEALRYYILQYHIDVLLTGGCSVQYSVIRDILVVSKQIKPEIKFIVGGVIITSEPVIAMRAFEIADYGIIGEGEITTVELCKALEEGRDVGSIAGIIYSFRGNFLTTQARNEIVDLDMIPFPDYDGFEFSKLVKLEANTVLGVNRSNTGVIICSRSCPYRCTFCFHMQGEKYRQRSLDNIFEEIDLLTNKYDIKFLFISDDLFTHDLERVKEFCARIEKYRIKWFMQSRVSNVTNELLYTLKAANCESITYGLESADNSILKSMKKNISVEQIDNALQLTAKAGLTIVGNFIFGDVNETQQTASNTLTWWKKNREYGIHLGLIISYPGTADYYYAVKNGIIKDEVEFLKLGCPIVNISKLSDIEYKRLRALLEVLEAEESVPVGIHDIIVRKNASADFYGTCEECGYENKWQNVPMFSIFRINCKHCGKYHRLPIFSVLRENFIRHLRAQLEQTNGIAFWGMGRCFRELILDMHELNDSRIYFIDGSTLKQGDLVEGKKVYAPSLLQNHPEIDIVVVAVPRYFMDIEEQIGRKFHRKVIHIGEMIAD